MIIVISKKELDSLDSSIFTLNHKICKDIVQDVYPVLKDKPNILITDEYVKENYYLNEEKIVSIMKSIYYLTGIPIVYMTKTLDYISSKYNTDDFIMIINEDMLTYPVMLLDTIIEDTDLSSPIKSNGITLTDGLYKIEKFVNSAKLCTTDTELSQFLNSNLDKVIELNRIFELLKQDNSIMKTQLNTKNATYDNIIEKLKLIEKDNKNLIDKLVTLNIKYDNLYNIHINNKALIDEYNRIYHDLSIYGVYNESAYIKNYINTDKISISKSPVILYIKEYATYELFKEFIIKLPVLLKENLGLLSKVIILENTESIRSVEYGTFTPYTHGLTLNHFLDFDYWVNYGNSHDILSLASNNEASQDLYIVWDRTLLNNDFIIGKNVIHLDLIDSILSCERYKLKPTSCMSKEITPIISMDKYKELLKSEKLLNTVLSNTKIYTELVRIYKNKRSKL